MKTREQITVTGDFGKPLWDQPDGRRSFWDTLHRDASLYASRHGLVLADDGTETASVTYRRRTEEPGGDRAVECWPFEADFVQLRLVVWAVPSGR